MKKRADWITPASIEMVRDMATAGSSNTEIARAVTKEFGMFVNGNMIAGRVGRMDDIPPRLGKRKPKRDPFDWVPLPKPTWGTAEADAIVVKAKVRFISTYKIGQYFGASDNMVTASLRRSRHAEKVRGYDEETRTLLQHESSEWPLPRMRRLIQLYERGLAYADIRADSIIGDLESVTHSSVQKKIERLAHAGIIEKRTNPIQDGVKVGRRVRRPAIVFANDDQPPRQVAAKRDWREAIPDDEEKPSNFWGKRQSHLGTKSSSIQWRAPTGVASVSKVPLCAWSGCGHPSDGKWCADHAELLQRPAQEIVHRLGTWR